MTGTAATRSAAWSDDVCRLALEVFDGLFDRCADADPDLGFGESYTSGRRSIEARQQAEAWALPIQMMEAAASLFDHVARLPDEGIGEWIDRFPSAFLTVIERRTSTRGAGMDLRRRFRDRIETTASG